MKKKRIYYHNLQEDVVKNVGQEYVLADDFVWISHSKAREVLGTLFYILIKCITSCIGALYYRIRIVHQETSRKELKSGCFLYFFTLDAN